MYQLYPYFTNDGSVGLFSPDADDIYHSTYGALTEAYEKFILPSNIDMLLKKNSEIKVLDICFGIGYNTKSLINYILNFQYNAQVYGDKNKTIDKIDTDNIKSKISVSAIDTDKTLVYLSPFFIANKKRVKNNEINFAQNKIKKLLSGKITPNYNLNKEVNIILLNFLQNGIDFETEQILYSKKYNQFFDRFLVNLFKSYKLRRSISIPKSSLKAFLHNIYYKYVSNSYKNAIKALKSLDFNFTVNIDDARTVISQDNGLYNLVFLDAFTPAKCPCLWTLEFFKILYEHLEPNGMILTYSNSAAVRNAFLHAGFFVGKIFSDTANKFTGTVAVKNKELIKYELSEYDLGLMKTKAGIFYRDENLTDSNEAIIARHKKEVEKSDLISSSKYIKNFRRENDI